MPQNRCLAVLFLWLGCLLTVARAGPLALYWEVGGKSLPVAGVEHNQAYCLVEGKKVPVPLDAKWRLGGDLRENARFVQWAPAYIMTCHVMPEWSPQPTSLAPYVTPVMFVQWSPMATISHQSAPPWSPQPDNPQPYVASVTLMHTMIISGKVVEIADATDWPEDLPTKALGVAIWLVDGRVAKLKVEPLSPRIFEERSTIGAEFMLSPAETDGLPVNLIWSDGAFVPVTPRFGDATLQAALVAVELNDGAALQAILNAGANATHRDRKGATLLHYAAEAGNIDAVNRLLAAGVKPDGGKEKSTPLHWAIKGDRLQVVERLLAAGANKDQKTDRPLEEALFCGFEDIAVSRIAAKESTKNINMLGLTPMLYALDQGMARVVRALHEQGESYGDKGLMAQVLITQASRGHTAIVKLLLENGVKPDVEADGNIALVAGALSGDPNLAKILIAAGASPAQRTATGLTALMAAAVKGQAAYAAVLLDAGAEANAQLPDGTTALHLATTAKAAAVTSLLLAHGANPTPVDKQGVTPLQMTLAAQARDAADTLAAAGAKIDLRAPDAAVWLEMAVSLDAVRVIKTALAEGWPADTKFRGSWPALRVAIETGAKGCVDLLRSAGAKDLASPEIPVVAKAKELDAPLQIVSTVAPEESPDFAGGFSAASVTVDIIVDRDGGVRFPRIVGAPDPRLAGATLRAVSQWRFAPPTRSKMSVATKVRLPVAFPNVDNLAMGAVEPDERAMALQRVAPAYPKNMRLLGIVGEVKLRFLVTAEGQVGYVRVVSSQHPEFDEAAVDAVKKWTFMPGQLKGMPVPTWQEQAFSFNLSR